MQKLIGRKRETNLLMDSLRSSRPEFVAVYGRRRIGKTYLVKQLLGDEFCFYMTGVYNYTKQQILSYFQAQLAKYSGQKRRKPHNWFEAFAQLRDYLSGLSERERLVIFIDELPWLDTPRSDFLPSFELFWNGWASEHSNLKLIVCGSATTWMTNKLIGDRGGLHNRVTRKIHLGPFCLAETEELLRSKGIIWTRHQIVECYMAMGGTPYYLEKLDKAYSLPQNLDRLFFSENAELAEEYGFLFRSLFKDAITYQRLVELLAKRAVGMRREEITQALGIQSGGKLSEALDNLINCDFIRRYNAFGATSTGALYQLTDLYTLFYLRYVKGNRGSDEQFWSHRIDSPSHRAWSGYAFEQVCLHHVWQIKRKLGINGIQSNVCSWIQRAVPEHGKRGAQIDLIIDRRDQVVNLCEIKYALHPYEITPGYMEEVIERREAFRQSTSTRKALHITFITTCGLKANAQSGMVQSEVSLDDLFSEPD